MNTSKKNIFFISIIAFFLKILPSTTESRAMSKQQPYEPTREGLHFNRIHKTPSLEKKSKNDETSLSSLIDKDIQAQKLLPIIFKHYKTKKTALPPSLRLQLETLLQKTQFSLTSNKNLKKSLVLLSAKFGDLSTLSILTQGGVNLEETDSKGRTAWLLAARADQIPTLNYLKSVGAHVNHIDYSKQSALHYAALSDNLRLFVQLLALGVTVDLHEDLTINPTQLPEKFSKRPVLAAVPLTCTS